MLIYPVLKFSRLQSKLPCTLLSFLFYQLTVPDDLGELFKVRIGFHGDEEKSWYEDQNQAPSWFVEQVSSLVGICFLIKLLEHPCTKITPDLQVKYSEILTEKLFTGTLNHNQNKTKQYSEIGGHFGFNGITMIKSDNV